MENIETDHIKKAEKLKKLIKYFNIRDFELNNGLKPNVKKIIIKRASGFGKYIYYFNQASRLMEIARSNIIELENSGKDIASGSIFFAEELFEAKGRLKRKWWSPKGGIYACIVIYPQCDRELWGLYSILTGLSIAEVLREWGLDVKIRWINDILLNNKKICGVLTECFISPISNQQYILLGMGLNINISEFPEYLPQASSILKEASQRFPEMEIAAHIFSKIGFNIALLHNWLYECLDMETENPIIKNWRLFTDSIGKKINFGLDAEINPEITNAIVKDVAEDGALIIFDEQKEELKINYGEIRYIE